MLDITRLLQDAIYSDNRVFEKRDLLLGPDTHIQEILVQFDRVLAKLYVPDTNYNLFNGGQREYNEIVRDYVLGLHWMLLFAARKQWTHLVVISKADYERLINSDKCTKLADLDRQYLTIKHFILSSFYTHSQDNYKHAWHLFLKYGLVDLGIDPGKIEEVHSRIVEEISE